MPLTLRGTAVVALLGASLVLASFADPSLGASGQVEPAPVAWQLSKITLDLELIYDKPILAGTATLSLENAGTSPVREVPLLLNRLMSVVSVKAGNAATLPVESSVEVFTDEPMRQVRRATVHLPHPVSPGASVVIEVAYRGPLVGYAETGWLYVKDHLDPAFTILREEALAFPRVAVLSSRVNDLAVRRPFAFEGRITVPDTEVVATGGTLVSRQARPGGRAVYEFRGAEVPFLNITIAPYTVTTTDKATVYALPDDAQQAAAVQEAVRRALGLLEQWYGPLRDQPRIPIIEIPDGYGSQASLTAGIILESPAFRDRARLVTLYHELTHLWNAPDLDQPSPRWNEGLAMFLQYRLASELDGSTAGGAALDRARKRLCGEATPNSPLRRTPFVRFGADDLTDWSYPLGFLMFAALEKEIGRQALDASLRAYVQDRVRTGGTTRQLVETIEQGTSKNLQPFFDRWMFTTTWVDEVCAQGKGGRP